MRSKIYGHKLSNNIILIIPIVILFFSEFINFKCTDGLIFIFDLPIKRILFLIQRNL